jgi:hypothetical protein
MAIFPVLEREVTVKFVFEQVLSEMTELGLADSSGLALMLRAASRAKAVLVLDPSPVLLGDVMSATGLSQVLQVEP